MSGKVFSVEQPLLKVGVAMNCRGRCRATYSIDSIDVMDRPAIGITAAATECVVQDNASVSFGACPFLLHHTALATMGGNMFVPASASGLPRDSVVNVTALVTLNKLTFLPTAEGRGIPTC